MTLRTSIPFAWESTELIGLTGAANANTIHGIARGVIVAFAAALAVVAVGVRRTRHGADWAVPAGQTRAFACPRMTRRSVAGFAFARQGAVGSVEVRRTGPLGAGFACPSGFARASTIDVGAGPIVFAGAVTMAILAVSTGFALHLALERNSCKFEARI